MLEPPKNPTNWDNFRKGAVLVLILWAAASAVLCIIYFFILGGRSPAPADIFRALILLVPFIGPSRQRLGSSARTRRRRRPVDRDRHDFTIYSGGWAIGRSYEPRGGPDHPRWFCRSPSLDR
jgi:hypothetical protein